MSSKVDFGIIGILEDGRLLLDNGFTMSGVDIEEIKHIEEVTGYEMPILVECPGIGYVFKEDLMKCRRFVCVKE